MDDAFNMKIAVIKYFRFQRQYPLIVTEIKFNNFIADILALKKIAVEIEIKTTYSDFLKELEKKKIKHKIYSNSYYRKFHMIPNKFYFAFPINFPVRNIENLIPEKYGIIRVNSVKDGLYIDSCLVERQAKFLSCEIDKRFWEDAVKRLTSENIGLREKIRNFKIGGKVNGRIN